jgi:transposase InsO family protein
VPRNLIVDNGTHFDSELFKEFCIQVGTKLCFALVRHPQSNGLVERANGLILQGISRRLHGRPKGKWAEELTSIIWSHNTSESRATKFTPFKLLFGEEDVLPEEIIHKSPRATFTWWDKHSNRRAADKRHRRRTQMPSSQ